MKTTAFALPLAAATLATAQSCGSSEPFYNVTSKPFTLNVASADGSIKSSLGACHVGAALESLCLSSSTSPSKPNVSDGELFHFNASIYSQPPEPTLGAPGILTWILRGNNFNYSSPASFNYDPTTDIAVPILGGGNPTLLAFDADDKLTVQGYVDYSVQPAKPGVYKQFYRWYACQTYYASYQYVNLAWGLGAGKPENPSCVAVNVTRTFV